jgi:hypothetical protein
VLQTVKKAERREAGEEGTTPGGYENFAAMHLLNDPQVNGEGKRFVIITVSLQH